MLHYKQEDISQDLQRHNEVGWRPGQEASLAPPCSDLSFFGSKYCIEESTCDVTLLGLFGAPRSHSALPW